MIAIRIARRTIPTTAVAARTTPVEALTTSKASGRGEKTFGTPRSNVSLPAFCDRGNATHLAVPPTHRSSCGRREVGDNGVMATRAGQ